LLENESKRPVFAALYIYELLPSTRINRGILDGNFKNLYFSIGVIARCQYKAADSQKDCCDLDD
jgi:hypothetical protein